MALDGRKIRWGILGSGKVAQDFVGALLVIPEEAEVVAVAARELASAERFAKSLSLTGAKCYEGYAGVASDPNVDVVYVATLPSTHFELASLCIDHGKAVLVEKPIATNAAEAAELIRKARRAGVFFMEAMWTRCFPAVRKARELLAEGAIGEVVSVVADFGWPADPNPTGPDSRLFNPVGGGVCLDIGEYPLGHCLLASSGAAPSRVAAVGSTEGPGTDWSVSASLSGFFGKPKLVASVLVTLRASTPEEAVFTGTKGTLRLLRPAHAPTGLSLTLIAADRVTETVQAFDFPLPPKAKEALPNNYPQGEGFTYEAQTVHDALRRGLKEAAEWTHSESVTAIALVDAMRAAAKAGEQAGVALSVPSIEVEST